MTRRVLYLFTAINILNYLDRYLVAAVLPVLSAELGLDKVQAGWLFSAFVPGYVIFSPIFGYLGDRISRPKLMALGALIWSLATIAAGMSTTFTGFLIARVLVGVGEASFGVTAPGWLKDKIKDPVKVNSALSLFYAAIPVGSALGYVLGGMAAGYGDWRMAFFCGGVPGIILAFFIMKLPEARSEKQEAPPLFSSLKLVTSNPIFWVVNLGYIFNTFALNGVAAFLPDYGIEMSFSIDEIGVIFGGILVVAGFVGTFIGGRLASKIASGGPDSKKRLLKFAGVSSMLGAPILLAGFTVTDPTLFLICCFFAEVLIFASVAPINSVIVLTCPKGLVTLTQGLNILLINLFGFLPAGPLVGAVAEAHTLRLGLQLLSVVLLASGLVWTFGSKLGALRSNEGG